MGRSILSGKDGCAGATQGVSTWAGVKEWGSWGLKQGLGDGTQDSKRCR